MRHISFKTRLALAPLLGAALVLGMAAAPAGPALAKKYKSDEVYTVKKSTKGKTTENCTRGPVPPFMRNPRFMNRGFIENRCKKN